MAIKDLFSRKKGNPRVRQAPQVAVQDLILAEKYDEAERVLNERLKKQPNDTATLRKLADVYAQTHRMDDALREYRRASDLMARDGFHDKAIATLAKAAKVAPGNAEIAVRIQDLRAFKAAEQRGSDAVDGLRGQERGKATKWIQMRQHWRRIKMASFVRMLDDDQIPRLFEALETVRVPADGAIARQGDADETLYIVTSGEIRISYRPAGAVKATVLRTYAAGEILGDRVLFERMPWAASYEAAMDSVLLKLTRGGLEKALVGNPDPRQLLNALRSQRRDGEVADLIQKLEQS